MFYNHYDKEPFRPVLNSTRLKYCSSTVLVHLEYVPSQLMTVSLCSPGVTIYHALPYVEPPYSALLNSTVYTHMHLPFVLMVYLPVLALGKILLLFYYLKMSSIEYKTKTLYKHARQKCCAYVTGHLRKFWM